LSPEEYYALPSITRFVDHIQNLPAVAGSAGALSPIAFALSNAPRIERVAEVSSKKKEKVAKAEAGEAHTPTPRARNAVQFGPPGGALSAGSKVGKEAKRTTTAAGEGVDGKKPKGGASPADARASAVDAGEPAPSMIDLRVGKIIQGAFFAVNYMVATRMISFISCLALQSQGIQMLMDCTSRYVMCAMPRTPAIAVTFFRVSYLHVFP
jgi:hypothetical protein